MQLGDLIDLLLQFRGVRLGLVGLQVGAVLAFTLQGLDPAAGLVRFLAGLFE